jgi:hypothetical protein
MQSTSIIEGLFVDLSPGRFIPLSETGDYPDDGELLCEYINPTDWERVRFGIITINPVAWYSRVYCGSLTLEDAFELTAKGWQRRLVKSFRRKAARIAQENYLVIDSKPNGQDGEMPRLVDGFHRLAAMAAEGIICALAVDMSQWKLVSTE